MSKYADPERLKSPGESEKIMACEMWEARATCADGTELDEQFPYREDGNYEAEIERQYELECYIIEKAECHGGATWYSVDYIG